MCIAPLGIWEIPELTAKTAHASFPKGNLYLELYEQLGQLYQDQAFASLYYCKGSVGLSPARLALVTIMQFGEGLTDRQTADAVRSRIDWKYVLGLELDDSGFNHSVLSEFRDRLLVSGQEDELLNALLEVLKEHKLVTQRGTQRSDSTHVIAAIRHLNRLECVAETLRQVLNELAKIAPEWLKGVVKPDWYERYESKFEQYRLPQKTHERHELALIIGRDGHYLLSQLNQPQVRETLRQLNSVEILRQVWLQQYAWIEGELVWRERQSTGVPPNGLWIMSPYDIEARNRTKRSTNWTGYSVQLSETCQPDTPNLITNVETTQATVADSVMTPTIHAHLEHKELLPQRHIVDSAYVSAQLLVESQQQYQVDLFTQVPEDSAWQARTPGAFDLSQFEIDWDQQQARCPAGQLSVSWTPYIDKSERAHVDVRFARQTCQDCPLRSRCTSSQRNPRILKLLCQPQHEAWQAARARQRSPSFREDYNQRAGVEGTISQATQAFEMRYARYKGLAKTHLQHVATAVAININRLMAWWKDKPRAQTRTSHFADLAAAA